MDKLTVAKATQTGCSAGVAAACIFGSVKTSGSYMPDIRSSAVAALIFLLGGIASSLLLAKFGDKERAFKGFLWLAGIALLFWFGSSPTVMR